MADDVADAYYTASWGPIRLWLASIDTDNGREIVVHSPTTGNTHTLQDRGRKVQRARCSLLFDDMTGETESAARRFRRFKATVDGGEEQLFTHPIDGTYLAKIGEFSYTITDDGVITNVIAEFIATAEVVAVSPATAGAAAATGEGAIGQAADDLDAALEAVDLSTDMTEAGRTAQASWLEDGTPSRQVFVDVANLSNELSSLIADNGLEDDLALWDAYRTAILFGAAVRSAAIAATAEVPSVFVLRVGLQPISLLVLCARIYGGSEAEDRARQVMALNDIRRPAWLDPGSELIMPAKSSSPRTNFAAAA